MDPITLMITSIVIYMLPAVVAMMRSHRNTAAITVLTVLLGWTMLGWVVALVWAFTANTSEKKRAKILGD